MTFMRSCTTADLTLASFKYFPVVWYALFTLDKFNVTQRLRNFKWYWAIEQCSIMQGEEWCLVNFMRHCHHRRSTRFTGINRSCEYFADTCGGSTWWIMTVLDDDLRGESWFIGMMQVNSDHKVFLCLRGHQMRWHKKTDSKNLSLQRVV